MFDENNLPTVTVGCPISNRSYLIDRYLDGILGLDYPKDKIKIYFLFNNSEDTTEYDLKRFKNKYIKDYLNITIEKYNIPARKDKRITGYRNETYRRLSELRNHLLSRIDTDYFFSVDSDIILEPNCLIELLKTNKEIIAAVINNDQILRPYNKHPQIRTNLLKDRVVKRNVGETVEEKVIVSHYIDFPLNEIIEIDYTGAVYLMKKEVCESVKYDFSELGEDIPFCENAKKLGYKIFAHTGLWQKHIMCEYMDYCIENKCQRPCVVIDGGMRVYQYRYKDNFIYPQLHRCAKLVPGEKSLLENL